MVDRRVGQFRATSCPICGSQDITNWTCPPCTNLVSVHRELIRNLQQWRSLFEAMEVPDTLVATNGHEYSLWDVEVFYSQRNVCSDRQQQAIQYCYYENLKESDAAVRMGIAPTNPVSVYGTIGLTTMLAKATVGSLRGYEIDLGDYRETPATTTRRRTPDLHGIEA